ncbi:o-succinylbenzoate synthase [Maribacter sp. ACAM166]|uniref:o-succinylbenzoate synthase n=1 Tax=Maribacter sp. ACAM166 TaxID=2508996 RepID=UPI0010FD0F5F|nr:o-succinylbenzoate synthase [Maribacter sp. ACAM166]TLP77597.1 o-succinylbenzoate synthase [Maribacter sp. ACAM166]
MRATFKKYQLQFKNPSGTSRGILRTKETWFIILEHNGEFGIGECGLFRGLSFDDVPEYEDKCSWVSAHITLGESAVLKELTNFPSIHFGVEQAFLSLRSQYPFELFESSFLKKQQPISINGLVWMGDTKFMLSQIEEKLKNGFTCIKMKIGAIDFNAEIELLKSIRKCYSKEEVELRVDANGAFSPDEALNKLELLSKLDLHSIEQPIKPGQWESMSHLCKNTPLSIALDEELIGIFDVTNKEELLQTIQPQYIILKPSLVGGFVGCKEWIDLAETKGIGWWITSALESNVGLNAIAQWTATLDNKMPQGLGTGSLFSNNFESPLEVVQGGLFYNNSKKWKNNLINDLCI